MAKYRQDLTQNVAPAAANVELVAQSSRIQADMARTIGEGIKTGVNIFAGYEEGSTLKAIRTDAEALGKEYVQRNEDFRQANELQSIADNVAKENEKGSEGTLAGLTERIQRLKEASKGGIRPEEQVTRVSALAREYIVRNPALADKIRSIVANETGVPGADLYYIHQTVKRDLAGGGQESAKFQQQLFANDLKEMSDTQGRTQTELYQLSVNNPTEFTKLRNDHNELKRLRAQTQAVEDGFKNATTMGDVEADNLKPGLAALVMGNVVDSVMTVTSTADQQSKFQNRIGYMLKSGDPAGSAELAAEAELWTKQNLAFVQRGKMYAMMALNDFAARNKISDGKFQEMKRYIDAQASVEEERWGDKNTITAQSLIMHKYGKEAQVKQAQLLDLTLKNIQGFGQDVIRQYMLTPDALKQANPNAFRIIDEAYGQVLTTGRTLNATNNTLGSVALYVRNAGQTGDVPQLPADMPKEDQKAVNDVIINNGLSAIKGMSEAGLTPQQMSFFKSGMSIAVQKGANAVQLESTAHIIKPKFDKLDPTNQGIIRDAVARNTPQALTAIRSVKEGVEAKYGVSLAIGINDNGDILPIKQVTDVYARPELANKENDAMREFREKATALTKNVVNTRFIVDGKTKIAIAREYADVLNGKTQYKPFFTLDAQPTTQPTAPAGKVASMSDVVRWAADKKISIDEAVQGLKADGYSVGE